MKAGRHLVVNEDTEVTNCGEHLIRRVVDEYFSELAGRPRALLGKHAPGIGMNQAYGQNRVPQADRISSASNSYRADGATLRRRVKVGWRRAQPGW